MIKEAKFQNGCSSFDCSASSSIRLAAASTGGEEFIVFLALDKLKHLRQQQMLRLIEAQGQFAANSK